MEFVKNLELFLTNFGIYGIWNLESFLKFLES